MIKVGIDRKPPISLRHPGLDPGSIAAPSSWTPDQVRGDEDAGRTTTHRAKTDIALKKVFPTLSGRASLHPALSFGEQKGGRCPNCGCGHDRTCRARPALRDWQIGVLTGLNFTELWNIQPGDVKRGQRQLTTPKRKSGVTPRSDRARLLRRGRCGASVARRAARHWRGNRRASGRAGARSRLRRRTCRPHV